MDAIGSVVWLVPCGRHNRYAKHLERNFKLLKLDTERLYNVRDALKEEIHRGLMMGKIPTAECKTWFEALEEIQGRIQEIELEFEHERRILSGMCFDLSLRKKLDERVENLRDEISVHLENSTFKQRLMVDAPLNITETITRPTIEAGTTSGPVKETMKTRGTVAEVSSAPPKQGTVKEKTSVLPKRGTLKKRIAGTIHRKRLERKRPVLKKDSETSHAKIMGEIIGLETEKIPALGRESKLIKMETTAAASVGQKEPAFTVEDEAVPEKVPIPITVTELELLDMPRIECELGLEPIPVQRTEAHMLPSKAKKEAEIDHTLHMIMDAIRDETIHKIGIYGMNGTEETIVLKTLNDQPEIKAMFDVVIWVTVSSDWSPKTLRKKIAHQLSLHLPTTDFENISVEKLFQLLSRRKFLIIMGDVWERISLDEVGIPNPNKQNGCRIVLTTKSLDVCHSMETNREIEVKGIIEEERLELFHEEVSEIVHSSDNIEPYDRDEERSRDLSEKKKKKGKEKVRSREPPKEEEQEDKILMESALSRLLESPESIAPQLLEGRRFLSKPGVELKQPPEEEEWEQAEVIFLMDNEFSMLPESPKCHGLLMLFLQRNFRLRTIPASFFEYMSALLVLDLSRTRIKSLPPSLSKLVNLQALNLRDCECLVVLPSQLGALKHLEVLDLQGTGISDMPNEIGELTFLRNLKLSFNGNHDCFEDIDLPPELIPPGIISRLLLLKDLSIVLDPEDQRWNKSIQAITKELSNLKELATIHFYFPEAEFLKLFLQISPSWKNHRLRKFWFIVGHHVKRFVSRVPRSVELEYEQQARCLRFVHGDTIPDAVLEVLNTSTAFYLDRHRNIHSLSEVGVRNMNNLELCILRECHEMRTIVDGTELTEGAFPMLKHLSVHYLHNLRSIWEGLVPPGSLAKLNSLTLCTCPKLSYILAPNMLQHLSNLEELVVEDCPSIQEIIIEPEIVGNGVALPKLKRVSLHYLPELVSIWKGVSPLHSLEKIAVYACPNLKNLYVDNKFETTIKEIKGEKDWWYALEWEDTALVSQIQHRFIQISYDDLLRRD